MPEFADNLRATATRLLTEKGQLATFNRETSTSFDHVTGIDTTTPSSFTAYGHPSTYNSREINGSVIQAGDIRFLMEGVTAPMIEDLVTIDGDIYRVIDVTSTKAQGTVVTYEVQLRK